VPEKDVANELQESLAAILPQLALELGQSRDLPCFGYTVTAVKDILRTKPFLVSQFGIDSVISGLVSIASHKSPYLSPDQAPDIYLNLCQTANILLSLYRKQIGGRFHLLVPLLQALLTCLFKPHADTKPPSAQQIPAWLRNPHKGYHPLESKHGIAYSRILSTLTQPTVSSTQAHYRSRGNPLLTDETRKARKYAAQFVPYVLMHYCALQLTGRLSSDIRKELLPSIWACIEAVPREALNGMNAGLRTDEKAVWAAVWSEWQRSKGQG
jgi:nucleolar pre-ribosomal-associated protein 2